jgi:S-DNA-T family DNA segregation ATPase FtsK/SpoIIIE
VSRTAAKSAAPLPAKLAGLLREAKWLAVVAVAVYLVLVLATYHRTDPSWSYSATDAVTRNAGGVGGAVIADVLLSFLGLSAYWGVALCVYVVVWGYRRLDGSGLIDRRPLALALGGFALLLVTSAALETLRLHSLGAGLPSGPGGAVGRMGPLLAEGIGFTGATLVLLMLAGIGLSLFTGVSWLAVSEAVGLCLETGYVRVRDAWDRRRDRKLGELAREERELVVGIEKLREEHHPPLRIEPPVVEIRKSERAQKEKQARLFEELPDTPLPPLKLLDEPRQEGEQVSAETLEFTSRLIEKKLSDFGVAVKVLAAYPGPVITRYEVEPAVGVKGSVIVKLV